MPKLELTREEARILALLLEKAGDEFANHGCNDFDLQHELGLTQGQATALAPKLRKEMVKTGCMEAEDQGSTNTYFDDWLLMRHFEAKIKALLEKDTP